MLILVKKKKMQRSAITVKRLIENHVFHSWKNSIKVEKEILSERVRVFPSRCPRGGLVCLLFLAENNGAQSETTPIALAFTYV